MTELMPPLRSLVLYKQRPGRVALHLEKKLEVRLAGNETVKVRPKDVTLLHPGPVDALPLRPPRDGEVEVAWELLAGEEIALKELAELCYGDFTPESAWAAWLHVADGLLFSGEPHLIRAHLPEQVEAEKVARAARAEAEAQWTAFLERVKAGSFAAGSFAAGRDAGYLAEIADLAYGRQERSRVMQALGRSESREAAHALLLEIGYWDATVNPYPERAQLSTEQPAALLPDLPPEHRLDLTHLPAYAVDDPGTQDPDDALSIHEGRLYVHIADVAALVEPDSPADLEARARGANLYLPEGVVHMLPPSATTTLALGMMPISPALTVIIETGADGTVRDVQITPSLVRVTRLSYEEVELRLHETPFAELNRLAQQFLDRRLANGAVTIDLPEVKVRVEDGLVEVTPLDLLRSRDMVREAMLLAGEAVARFAGEHDIPIAYSTQEAPEGDMDQGDNSFAGMFARRRQMRRSQYRGTPVPHAGLGMALYTQCTSPLRRYLDLVVHQQLRAHLAGRPVLSEAEVMERVGAADAVVGATRWAERRSLDHWRLVYLQQHPDWRGDGIVVEQRGARAVVLIPALALEPELYLRKEQPLNSTLRLQVESVDLPLLEARFRPA